MFCDSEPCKFFRNKGVLVHIFWKQRAVTPAVTATSTSVQSQMPPGCPKIYKFYEFKKVIRGRVT